VYYNEKLWEIVWSQAIITRTVYYGTTFYPDYTVTLKLRRTSWVDRKIAVLPTLREEKESRKTRVRIFPFLSVAACLTLATFWTHPMAKSRLLLGVANLVILVLLLLFLRSRLPMAGGQLPLVGILSYYSLYAPVL